MQCQMECLIDLNFLTSTGLFWVTERFQVKSIASMQRHNPHARATILQENWWANQISLTYRE